MTRATCALGLSSPSFLMVSRAKGLTQVGVTGTLLLTCHRLQGTALPTRRRLLQPLCECLNYGFTQSFTLPGSTFSFTPLVTLGSLSALGKAALSQAHISRGTLQKKYLALNLTSSLVHSHLEPYPGHGPRPLLGAQACREHRSPHPHIGPCFQAIS